MTTNTTLETATHTTQQLQAKLLISKEIDGRDTLEIVKALGKLETEEIEQFYPTASAISDFVDLDSPIPRNAECQIRKKTIQGETSYTLSLKSDTEQAGNRERSTIPLEESTYEELKARHDSAKILKKTRYTLPHILATREDITITIDDFEEVTGEVCSSNFYSCEVNVSKPETLHLITSDHFFAVELGFLKSGVNVTGNSHYLNQVISEVGLPVESFSQAQQEARISALNELQEHIVNLQGLAREGKLQELGFGLVSFNTAADSVFLQIGASLPGYEAPDLALRDRSFTRTYLAQETSRVAPSHRKEEWLANWQTIAQSDPYVRLNHKPQIFRIDHASSNTTVRGMHCQDVATCAVRLASQLGVDYELAVASAALHDIGHSVGGHVGEEYFFELSGLKFEHHIFSLSLAKLFDLDLRPEVMWGAFYHKSGGGPLVLDGLPEEFTCVRIADKICYAAWDIRDSILQGWIRDDHPDLKRCKQALGETPEDWVATLISAVVEESKAHRQVRFTEKSPLFESYLLAKDLVKREVHPYIDWDTHKAAIKHCYGKILEFYERTFEGRELNDNLATRCAVATTAYMTDRELYDLSQEISQSNQSKPFDLSKLDPNHFGFMNLAKIFMSEFYPPNLFFSDQKEFDSLVTPRY